MKSLAVLSLAATLVSAQIYANQTQPFTLKISDAANATLNGFSMGACHAGAAIEAACIGQATGPAEYFYLNYSSNTNEPPENVIGILTWNLPTFGINNTKLLVSSPMELNWNVQSNVAPIWFIPSSNYQAVGFDADNKLFLQGYYDDSNFTAEQRPTPSVGQPLYHWYACWNLFTSYYYFSIAWVSAGVPTNPTCSAVNITRTFV